MQINVKTLSYWSPQPYTVKRTLAVAQSMMLKEYSDREASVTEITVSSEIEKNTPVAILPSLVVNEKRVFVGSFPHQDETISWLREALHGQPERTTIGEGK